MSDAPRERRAAREHGLVTIQYVFAVGISFVLLVLVANLLVDLYARAAVRDALEEGTRAAVPIDAAPSACADRARAVLHGLLRGPIGRDIRVHCDLALGVASATAEVRLHSWLPGMAPDWKFTVRSVAVRDR